MNENCPERIALGKALGDAVGRVYEILDELSAAKKANADAVILDEIYARLRAARDVELSRERAYSEHTKARRAAASGT